MSDPTPPESAPVPLKPCPFCGGDANAWQDYDDEGVRPFGWRVSCLKCHIRGDRYVAPEYAIAAWNTRHVDKVLADPATVNAVTRAIAAAWCDGAGCTGANPCGVCDNRAASALIVVALLIEGPRT